MSRKKEDKMCWSRYETTLESAKVTSTVSAQAMHKKEKPSHLRIYEMTTDFFKSTLNSTFISLEAKDIYSHIAQGQENIKPFWGSVLL